MAQVVKRKRYHGRTFNVTTNVFFEDLMAEVARGIYIKVKHKNTILNLWLLPDKNNILSWAPTGCVSKSKAFREYGLNIKVREAFYLILWTLTLNKSYLFSLGFWRKSGPEKKCCDSHWTGTRWSIFQGGCY